VIGQQGDAAHPASIAEELAGLLPGAELQVYDDDGILWGHRAQVRTRISTFLNHP
jgi:hypothetical protein